MRAKLHFEEGDAMLPRKAVVLYGSRNAAFAMVHDITSKRGSAELEAGKPLTNGMLRALARTLSKQDGRRGVLPECVLAADDSTLVWYEKPQVRRLHFRLSDAFASRSIGTATVTAAVPGVVFVVHRGDWWVTAFKGDARPTADTPLYRAPFLNVHRNYQICTGSVRKPSSAAASAVEEWSKAFWLSFFTHANFEGVVDYEGDIAGYWRDQAREPAATFPEKILVAANLTVGDVVSRVGL